MSYVCNSNDFANNVDPCLAEAIIRGGTPSVPKGGVAFVGPSDLHTSTKYNNVINAPLSAGSGSSEFRTAFNEVIFPGLRKFSPDLLIVSAGFDAHADDPLASLNLQEDDFSWVTLELLSIAEKYSDGRLVSVLEGGYNLEALSSSASIHVRQLMSV